MSGVSSVVNILNGPRRLRLALKQKTAPVRTLMAALDGPGELRVRIPASVFGGDIFGVMSQQLREALVFAPPAPAPALKTHRKRTLLSADNPVLQNPQNSSPLAHGVKQSTLPSVLIDNVSTLTAPFSVSAPSSPGSRSSDFEGSAERVSRPRAGEAPAISGTQTNQLPSRPIASSTRRGAPAEPALVGSLKRYWDSISHIRGSQRQPTSATEPVGERAGSKLAGSTQTTTPRNWPSLIGRDVSARLSSFDDSQPKSTRSTSLADHQIQNVFNISVNHANQPTPTFDDLGERIAEILHEQALQHGIDVT